MKEMFVKFVEISGKPERLFIAGGGSKNEIWVTLIEKELNKNVEVVNTSPCLGAARLIF